MDSQPPSASKAAASEHMPAAQHLMPAAQAQHQDSGGMEHCAKQGRQSLGSAETSREVWCCPDMALRETIRADLLSSSVCSAGNAEPI